MSHDAATPPVSTLGSPGWDLTNLPFGVFSATDREPRVGVAIGEQVLDLAGALGMPVFATGSLNPFMAQGPELWARVRTQVATLLSASEPAEVAHRARYLLHQSEVTLHLPVEVADFVDFFSSLEHASNAGKILRPGEEPLKPNWRHLPVGYHGRAGTVVASGTPVQRPCGQTFDRETSTVAYGPSTKLDLEVELGYIVGVPTQPGDTVAVEDFDKHVFGTVVLLDWSARDIQAWEYVPLGPFLGKSFATSISPWVVPLAALTAAEREPEPQDPAPLPHLSGRSCSYDIDLELRVNGHLVSQPNAASMYWTPAQQLAHMTSNGAALRTGDVYGTGTISGWSPNRFGSLMELSWNGQRPLTLPSGDVLTYLNDGDVVSVRASAADPVGGRVDFGEVTTVITPARDHASSRAPSARTSA